MISRQRERREPQAGKVALSHAILFYIESRDEEKTLHIVAEVSTVAEGIVEVGARRRTRSSSMDLDINSPGERGKIIAYVNRGKPTYWVYAQR
jgi:hypothetical protein